jgi:Tfp pilus assembly protein PilZ
MERRRAKRYSAKRCKLSCAKASLLSFLRRTEEQAFPVINISEGGLQFLSRSDMPQGVMLALTVEVPGEEQPLRMKGRVAWAKKVPNRPAFRIGIEFTKIAERVKKRIEMLKEAGKLEERDLSSYLRRR